MFSGSLAKLFPRGNFFGAALQLLLRPLIIADKKTNLKKGPFVSLMFSLRHFVRTVIRHNDRIILLPSLRF